MPNPRYPIGPLEIYGLEVGITGLITQMAETPQNLRTAVAGMSSSRLDTPYREGGWTVRQIGHHLADSQINWYIRTKLALTEKEPAIKPYDADRWSEFLDARSAPIENSLLLLDGLYGRWIPLRQAVTFDQWEQRKS